MTTDRQELMDLLKRLDRLAALGESALRHLSPGDRHEPVDFATTLAARWAGGEDGALVAVGDPDLPRSDDLLGIERQLKALERNTLQFVRGLPANNVLLWGERGTGKSTAVRSLLTRFGPDGLRMIEVQKEQLFALRSIVSTLRHLPWRFVLYCDDLSFDEHEIDYRELKALLEGSLEAPPENVRLYATSNRRHLMPERMLENTDEEEIHPEERRAEKLSLSDRFGISLGFYPFDQPTYLQIVRHLAKRRNIAIDADELERRALHWAGSRGARSGRVARQFVDDLAGQIALEADKAGKKA
ncbi:MAG: ATP-binding protein [Deltaproteobacteria bacterium]|nr:MAG: ATP-binding protein [Deltaproteobacteria bacterium]